MNYNLQNKLTKFGIYIVLYVFGIFVFFNLVFDKKEMKTEVTVNNVEEIKNLNANGIDVSKLSTKVNTGKKANILTRY